MQIDYKRDLNHTYFILQDEKEPDTASYQLRMLLTNTIPGLLECKIGKLDDKTLFYYDITSRQSLSSVFEQRSIGAAVLRKLFECLLDLLEQLGQYLLTPDGLVLQPELIFSDAALEAFSFCYLPGKQGHAGCFQDQIRSLMEYLLPKLDHQEQDAVVLGYGLYREIASDVFSMEAVQTLLYRTGKEKDGERSEDPPAVSSWETEREEEKKQQMEPESDWDFGPEERKTDFQGSDFFEEPVPEQKTGKWKNIAEAVLCIGFLSGVLALRWTQAELVWYIVLACLAAVTGCGCLIAERIERRKQRRNGFEDREDPSKLAGWSVESQEEQVEKESGARNNGRQAGMNSNRQYRKQQTGEEPKRKDREWPESGEQEDDLFEKTELLVSMENEEKSCLVPVEPVDLPFITLERGSTLIGKLPAAADVVLPYRTVSRLHAKIISTPEGDYLIDLNSRNGTSVNGVPLMGEVRKKLENEDDISFAGKKYRYKAGKNRYSEE